MNCCVYNNIGRSAKLTDLKENPNDIVFTPLNVAKLHIGLIDAKEGETWLDPFRGGGVYYNNFPTEKKDYCEIVEGKDFFLYDKPVDIICSNPPFSLLDRVIEQSIFLSPRIISYIWGALNTTPKRLKVLNDSGYGLVCLHYAVIRNFGCGTSLILVFEKNRENMKGFSYSKDASKLSAEEEAQHKEFVSK